MFCRPPRWRLTIWFRDGTRGTPAIYLTDEEAAWALRERLMTVDCLLVWRVDVWEEGEQWLSRSDSRFTTT